MSHNDGFQTERPSQDEQKCRHSRNKSKLEKTYSKKTAKTTLERSRSNGRYNSKRTETNEPAVYASQPPINFFSSNESLTTTEEKELV